VTDEKHNRPETPPEPVDEGPEGAPPAPRFPELETLQQEVERRIRDNRKFLEGFLDDDYVDDEPPVDDEPSPEDFEEL